MEKEKRENRLTNCNKTELVNIHAEAQWDFFFFLISWSSKPFTLLYSSTNCTTMDANVILRPLWIILLKCFKTE